MCWVVTTLPPACVGYGGSVPQFLEFVYRWLVQTLRVVWAEYAIMKITTQFMLKLMLYFEPNV
jgi:hypothetical protein